MFYFGVLSSLAQLALLCIVYILSLRCIVYVSSLRFSIARSTCVAFHFVHVLSLRCVIYVLSLCFIIAGELAGARRVRLFASTTKSTMWRSVSGRALRKILSDIESILLAHMALSRANLGKIFRALTEQDRDRKLRMVNEQ